MTHRPYAHALLAVFSTALFAGCAMSPPKAPIPNETRKVPANDRRELALLSCTTDLAVARIEVAETHRLVASATAVAGELQVENARLAASARAAPSRPGPTAALVSPPSQIFVAFHRTNSPVPELTEAQAAELIAAARTAARIEIRGRTDGHLEGPAESRIARLRAEHMRDWLVRAGVSASRIAATWQPIGDHLGPNDTAEGRAINRRVEIEVYAVAPVTVVPPAPASATRPAPTPSPSASSGERADDVAAATPETLRAADDATGG